MRGVSGEVIDFLSVLHRPPPSAALTSWMPRWRNFSCLPGGQRRRCTKFARGMREQGCPWRLDRLTHVVRKGCIRMEGREMAPRERHLDGLDP